MSVDLILMSLYRWGRGHAPHEPPCVGCHGGLGEWPSTAPVATG
jgi:hypothetical protein